MRLHISLTAPSVHARSEFTAKLDIPQEAKAALLELTPASYVGNAALQARHLQQNLKALG
jgi:hypothetical protein